MLKRVFLFLVTNIAVMITLSVIVNLLGLNHYMTANGINFTALIGFCLVWGMVGSLISLMMSRKIAKISTRAKVIDPKNPGQYAWLVEKVHFLSRRANLPKMPEVAVYPSPEINAFATGPTKSRSLVAMSEGIMNSMTEQELEGVIAHEVAHIQNGDMVTLTLLTGVVNAFSMFLSRVISFVISRNFDEDKRYLVHFVSHIFFDIVFMILGSLVVRYFSRVREFKADLGSAKLSGGREFMISALRKLQNAKGINAEANANLQPSPVAAMKISSSGKKSFMSLFATHPDLEDRIKALEKAQF